MSTPRPSCPQIGVYIQSLGEAKCGYRHFNHFLQVGTKNSKNLSWIVYECVLKLTLLTVNPQNHCLSFRHQVFRMKMNIVAVFAKDAVAFLKVLTNTYNTAVTRSHSWMLRAKKKPGSYRRRHNGRVDRDRNLPMTIMNFKQSFCIFLLMWCRRSRAIPVHMETVGALKGRIVCCNLRLVGVSGGHSVRLWANPVHHHKRCCSTSRIATPTHRKSLAKLFGTKHVYIVYMYICIDLPLFPLLFIYKFK
ncbi:hypothetical protein ECC02_003809 [Trypanosoma cruzi]|uniref:Uncharacterized protein n=1 Tax=Trypanosoma cruzi TaxID=5693 RepID=A0A7J6Y8U8_TRYCR|nr:hypothetical protein ECC02_003809 [Trypanosoma cruzi]